MAKPSVRRSLFDSRAHWPSHVPFSGTWPEDLFFCTPGCLAKVTGKSALYYQVLHNPKPSRQPLDNVILMPPLPQQCADLVLEKRCHKIPCCTTAKDNKTKPCLHCLLPLGPLSLSYAAPGREGKLKRGDKRRKDEWERTLRKTRSADGRGFPEKAVPASIDL